MITMSNAKNSNDSVRRRQPDRAADTRHKVIQATIRCLYRAGYSATTFATVAAEAKVSRGIITYHFANKSDLMVAVRDAIQAEEQSLLEEHHNKLGTRAYLTQLPKLVLNGMRREPAVAVNEILLAARGDPKLIAKLRATEIEIEKRSIAALESNYRELGLEPPTDLLVMTRVSVAAFRGLAIAELVFGADQNVDASAEYLDQLFRLRRKAAAG